MTIRGVGDQTRRLQLVYLVWVVTSALLTYWFVEVILNGLLHVGSDVGGNLVFQSTPQQVPFYPFTLAAALLSFVGVTYFVLRAEGVRWWSVLLALVVAEVSTVGMINLYEQLFIVPMQLASHNWYWINYYWGGLGFAAATILGISWVLAGLPWWRRENARWAGGVFGAYLATMLVWLAIGFPSVESGSWAAYLLNTVSRLLSQATLVVLVADPRWVARLRAHIRRLSRPRVPG
ncbi:MAG: hypothetical protein L3K18_02790 [Thermoplasmata archaeon]|nr:hypothetical protein [Thermoplasmata archaeon]